MTALSGAYAETAVDSNADGSYDYLALEVGIEVADVDNYLVSARLDDSQGNTVAYGAPFGGELAAGIQSVELRFDGTEIWRGGVDGPYSIGRVELSGAADFESVMIDNAQGVLTTQSYARTDFVAPDVWLSRVYTDGGRDTNADGVFDLLDVTSAVSITATGAYSLTASLYGADGSYIASALTATELISGLNAVELSFDGRSIANSRHDGPYSLRNVQIAGTDGMPADVDTGTYATSPYQYTEFTHGPQWLSVLSDERVTQDYVAAGNDGEYAFLRIQYEIGGVPIGTDLATYRVLATLTDADGVPFASVDRVVGSGSTVNSVVGSAFDFLGGDIREHCVDGPYQLTDVTLLDANGAVLDSIAMGYDTMPYGHLEFAPRAVAISGYADRGVDSNGNGLYEYLAVDVAVDVRRPGPVFAEAALYDGNGEVIDATVAEVVAAVPGGTTLTLLFSGPAVFANGKDGPYELRDLRMYHEVGAYPDYPVEISSVWSTAPWSCFTFECCHDSNSTP